MTRTSFAGTVFLSHNSAEKSAVIEIQRRLEAGERPIPCWLDKDDLRATDTWMTQLERILQRCEVALVFVGPHGEGPIHRKEKEYLVARESRDPDHCRVIPVVLPGASPAHVQGFLQLYNWVDFSAGLDSADAFQRLTALIRGEAPRTAGIHLDPLVPKAEPYRGLERFDGQHAEFFFGRDAEIVELCRRLDDWPFTAVIGASGSGKSSVVRAGLRTTLALKTRPALAATTTIIVLPGSNPIRSLAEAVVEPLDVDSPERLADDFEQRFLARPDGLVTALASRFPREEQHVLVIVDQFEEIFTHSLASSDSAATRRGPQIGLSQAEQFVELLAAVAASGRERLRLVVTLRADFFDRCLAIPRLVPLLQNHQLLLGELSHDALRTVIVQPAQHVGAYFEKGLVARILKDVENQHGSLPLLQHALKELWDRRRFGWLTDDGYDATGGVAGALKQRADATLAKLSAPQREIAKQIFLRLTTLGEGVSDTRRRVRMEELYPAQADQAAIDEVLRQLSDKSSRLIVTNDDRTTEVTHEALIQQWDVLKKWLDDNRDDKRLLDRLRDAALEWSATPATGSEPHDPSFLWEAGRLDLAEQFTARQQHALTSLEQDFLNASIRKRESEAAEIELRRRRRLLLVSAVAAACVVLSVVFASLWRYARQKELDARSASLTANEMATTARRDRYVAEIQLAQQAGHDNHLVRMHELLERHTLALRMPELQGLEDLRGFEWFYLWRLCHSGNVPLVGHQGDVTVLAFAPNAPVLASGCEDRTVRLWDLSTRPYGLKSTLNGHSSAVTALAFSLDGKRLASGSTTGEVKVWDAVEGMEVAQITAIASVESLRFHPDDDRLAFGTGVIKPGRSEIGVLDLATGNIVFRQEEQEPVFAVGFISGEQKLISVLGSTHQVKIHDAQSGAILDEPPPLGPNAQFALNADGSVLAKFVGQDGELIDTKDFEKRDTLRARRPIHRVVFGNDGKSLAGLDEQGTCSIWDQNGKEFAQPPAGIPQSVSCLALFASGEGGGESLRLAWGGDEMGVAVWDQSPEKRLEFDWKQQGDVTHVLFSPDGHYVATISRYATSPDRPMAAMVEHRTEVRVWDVLGERVLFQGTNLDLPLRIGALDSTGRYLAAVTDDGAAAIWDLQTGQPMHSLDRQQQPIAALAFGPTEGQLATVDGTGKVRLWDWPQGTEVRSFTLPGRGTAVTFNDSGTLVAAATDDTAQIWEVATGRLVDTFSDSVHDSITHLAFGDNDQTLVAISRPGLTEAWNLAEKNDMPSTAHGSTPPAHASAQPSSSDEKPPRRAFAFHGLFAQGYADWPEHRMACTSDGTRLATGVLDGKVKIWDLRTAQEVLTLSAPSGFVNVLAFSPGARILVAGYQGGHIHLWRAATDGEVDADRLQQPQGGE